MRLSSRQDEIPAQPKPSCDDVDLLASELSHTHLSQLQHRQKLMAVQVQKTEQDIQREVMKIKQDEQKLHNMRYLEHSKLLTAVTELVSTLQREGGLECKGVRQKS